MTGVLPDNLTALDWLFDLILMLVLLEYIDDDCAALHYLRKQDTFDGWPIMTLPAFQFFWDRNDTAHYYKRRHRCPDVIKLLQSAGFNIERCSF